MPKNPANPASSRFALPRALQSALGYTPREAWAALACWGIAAALAVLALRGISDWRLTWPDRAERGLSVRPEHLARTFLYWTSLAGAALALVMGLTARRWVGRLEPEPAEGGRTRWRWKPWCLWLILILLAAWGLRLPRMSLSLYNDEVYGFERYVAGRFAEAEPGETPARKPLPWSETWWANRLGNNFPLYSAAARVSHEVRLGKDKVAAGEVSAQALRLPALLGGLASLALAALWLAQSGRPGGGLLAAALLAIHPAHVRYSTEARGYGLAFAGVMLAAWMWWKAAREDKWRWWAGCAAGQTLLLLSYPGAIYGLAVLNAGAFAWLASRVWRERTLEPSARRGRQMLGRWLASNAAAALVFSALCLPQIYQAHLAHADPHYMKIAMPPGWWLDTAAFLFWGVLWKGGSLAEHMPGLATWPLWASSAALAAPLLLLGLALRRPGKPDPAAWLAAASVPAALLLAWLHNASRGVYVHYWYAVHLVPLLVASLALGLSRPRAAAASGTPDPAKRPAPLPLALGLAAVLWGGACALHWRTIAFHGKEPLLQVIEAARGSAFPRYLGEAGERALLGGFFTNANVYDPNFVVIRSEADLEALVSRALAEGRPLFITHGEQRRAFGGFPEIMRALHESGRFETAGVYHGLGGTPFSHHLLRLKPPPD